MKKMNINNSKEQVYVESRTLRDEAVNNANVDFLDKIKAVQYLNEDMIMSIDQIANYYEVSKNSIKTIISRNRDEFESDGMKILVGEELKEFKNIINAVSNETELIGGKISSFTILTKRSLLRVGLIMTSCAMATRIRNYLLNLEEVATVDQKAWAIQREVGKIERKRITSAIHKYIPESPKKRFAYPNYTNMLYKAIFNKKADELRVERNVKDNDALRDSFSADELKLIEEGETIITALIALGFDYEYVKDQMFKKYSNKLPNI